MCNFVKSSTGDRPHPTHIAALSFCYYLLASAPACAATGAHVLALTAQIQQQQKLPARTAYSHAAMARQNPLPHLSASPCPCQVVYSLNRLFGTQHALEAPHTASRRG